MLRSDAASLSEDRKDDKGVLQYQGFLYIPEIIHSKVISCQQDDLPTSHFGIDKTQELMARKYYWPTLHRNVKTYVKGCDMYLASKVLRYKPYGDLQSLPIPIYW